MNDAMMQRDVGCGDTAGHVTPARDGGQPDSGQLTALDRVPVVPDDSHTTHDTPHTCHTAGP